MQGQGKKEDMEVRTWHIWEHRIIFILWVIDRNCLNINLINYEMYYGTYCWVCNFVCSTILGFCSGYKRRRDSYHNILFNFI